MDKSYFLSKLNRYVDTKSIKEGSRKQKALEHLHSKTTFGTFDIIVRRGIPVLVKVDDTNLTWWKTRNGLITFSVEEMRNFILNGILND